MHFPRYWAKADAKVDDVKATAAGWSDVSAEEATARARATASRVATAIAEGGDPTEYYSMEGPVREELIRELSFGGNGRDAAITRNRYGCLVLNSERVMFIDIDDAPPPLLGGGGLLGFLFRSKKRAADAPDHKQAQQARIVAALQAKKDLRVAMYRTAAGFRLIVLNHLYDPKSDEVELVLREMGCDPLYIRLTEHQECFRARLSPKPWRCGYKRPARRFPYTNPGEEDEQRRWELEYEVHAERYATCAFIGEYGNGRPLPEASFISDLHDSFCLRPGLPLA